VCVGAAREWGIVYTVTKAHTWCDQMLHASVTLYAISTGLHHDDHNNIIDELAGQSVLQENSTNNKSFEVSEIYALTAAASSEIRGLYSLTPCLPQNPIVRHLASLRTL